MSFYSESACTAMYSYSKPSLRLTIRWSQGGIVSK